MGEDLHHIEILFETALNDIEGSPSPKVWEYVDKQLDKEKIFEIGRKY